MGLGDFTEPDDSDSSSKSQSSSSSSSKSSKSSSSSSSSGSSGGSMPKYKRVCPEVIIREDEDGNILAQRYPNTPEVTLKKEWYGQPFTLNDDIHHHQNWRKYWLSKTGWEDMVRRCKQVTGIDLNQLIKENPEKAVRAINETAQNYNTDTDGPSRGRSCGVCDSRLDPILDDCREVGGRLVCERHSVEDLHHAGLL